jgi:lipoprotein-releasing system ATP-binding protein
MEQANKTSGPVLVADNISKRYVQGDLSVDVLNALSLTINKGDRIAIVGSSGSGKSTLLHLLGGLDQPTEGSVTVNGQNLKSLGQKAIGMLRNRSIGFVYQFHHLLPEFTALENVAMPLMIRKESVARSNEKAAVILERVGLGQRLRHKPTELSGGERQRAAIARALVTDPQIVLADEPTGNLDERTADTVYELMLELNQESGTSFLIVTHDTQLAARMDTVYTLTNGTLSS